MYQNAGEKGIEHPDPDDPPRRRANKRPGHGNFANDRPPVAGVSGRDSGGLRARVVERTDRATLEAFVEGSARPGAMVYTDEGSAYASLKELGFGHATCHRLVGSASGIRAGCFAAWAPRRRFVTSMACTSGPVSSPAI
jgi:transposase